MGNQLNLAPPKERVCRPVKNIRQRIKRVTSANALPAYHLSYRDDTDQTIFDRRLAVDQSPQSVDQSP